MKIPDPPCKGPEDCPADHYCREGRGVLGSPTGCHPKPPGLEDYPVRSCNLWNDDKCKSNEKCLRTEDYDCFGPCT